MAFLALPKDQRDVYEAVGYREKLEAVDEGIRLYVVPCHVHSTRFHADGVGTPNL
jgi:hypothetical protein